MSSTNNSLVVISKFEKHLVLTNNGIALGRKECRVFQIFLNNFAIASDE